MPMAHPAGPVVPVVAPPVVVPLTGIQVTDPATGTVVMTMVAGVLNGASITHANGQVTYLVNGSPAHEQNGGPVVGTLYDITSAQGNFLGVQFLVSPPFMYRFQ